MAKRIACLGLVFIGLISITAFARDRAQEDSRWELAQQHWQEGRYQAAAVIFRQLRTEFPGSQRAAYQLGRCEHQAGNHWEAATALGEAYDTDPESYWAEPSLFYRALACRDGRCTEIARDALDTLFEHYPDSAWTARAAVLEAELYGDATESADLALATELEAGAELDGAMNPRVRATAEYQMQRVQNVIDNYPNTATALRARKSLAHLQIRQGRKAEAVATLETLLGDLEASAPQSRIVEESRERLAGLYHSQGRKVEALEKFEILASSARNRKIRANAKLQASGLDFELLQKRRWAGEEIDSQEWIRIRGRCQGVLEDEQTNGTQKARAELMILESYLWEKNPEECLARAEAYIESHSYPEYRRELATAYLFAGESLLRLGEPERALRSLEWIETEYQENGDIWPWDYLVARTYYRIYDAKQRLGDPDRDAQRYATFVIQEFPDTTCADLLRRSRSVQ